jgi:ABC-type sugar transport system ATPase subunit
MSHELNLAQRVRVAQNDQPQQSDPKPKLKRKEYEEQIAKFHAELVKLPVSLRPGKILGVKGLQGSQRVAVDL